LMFFGALTQTELGRATLLCYTYVLFSALFSALALQERLRPGALVALLLSIVGVGLITGTRPAGIGRGDTMGLLAGLTGGGAITSIRELRKTETAYAILVVFCAFGLATSLLMAREPWVLPRGGMLWALGGIAVFGTAGQLLMTAAYRYCSVAAGGLLSLVTVV